MQPIEESLVTHVVVTWGDDYPLCAVQQPRGEPLALGGPGSAPGLDAVQPWVLLDVEGRLHVPADATLHWSARADTAPLPLPCRQREPAWMVLREGDRLCLRHAGLWFHLEVAERERRRWHGLAPQRWERGALWAMAGSVGLHGLFLVMGWLLPPTAAALSRDLIGEDLARARYLITPSETSPPPPTWLADQGSAAGAEAAPAPEAEGAAGDPRAPRVKRRMSSPRAERRTEPLDAADVRKAGILDYLGVADVQPGPSVFDPNTLIADARVPGGPFGAEVGTTFGFGGLEMDHAGRGGGGPPLGTRKAGPLGTHGGDGVGPGVAGPVGGGRRNGSGGPPRVRGKAEVTGSLSKEAIRRTIRRHTNEVRFCYEQGLRARPDLAGRVRVFFLIQPDGSVGSATLRDSELGAPGVETCLVHAVGRWAFPRPEGGGLVQVTYPFLLQTVP